MTTSNALIFCKNLIESGVPPKQALEQALALDSALEHVATKEDLSGIEKELDGIHKELALKATKEDLKIAIKDLKFFVVYTMLGFIYAPVIVAIFLKWFGKI